MPSLSGFSRCRHELADQLVEYPFPPEKQMIAAQVPVYRTAFLLTALSIVFLGMSVSPSAAQAVPPGKDMGVGWCAVYENGHYRTVPCPRGGGSGRGGSTNNNADAARAERERAEREKAEREAAEAEQKRVEEENRLKAEADKKAFNKSRDETILRGSLGTSSGANSSGGMELRGSGAGNQGDPPLRGSRIDTGIRTGKPNTVERDFSGPNAAWKELFCAASILGPAVAALNVDDQGSVKADFSGFKTLASEAINALNGEVKGVPCAKAPQLPGSARGSANSEAMIESGKRLVTKAVDLATKLEKARIQKTGAEAELKRPSPLPPVGSDENVVARQRAINKVRDEEAKRITDAQRNFNAGVTTEKEAKADLKKIADAVKKAEENPENLGTIFNEVAPPTVTPKAAPTTPSKPTVRRPVRH